MKKLATFAPPLRVPETAVLGEQLWPRKDEASMTSAGNKNSKKRPFEAVDEEAAANGRLR